MLMRMDGLDYVIIAIIKIGLAIYLKYKLLLTLYTRNYF